MDGLLDILRVQLGTIVKGHFVGAYHENLSRNDWRKDIYDDELNRNAQDNDSGRTSRASTLLDGIPILR